jgi:uracil-DNA glycosylase
VNDAVRTALRELARGLDRIDVEVYAEAGRDPLEPIVGEGDRRCRVAVLGRDPGRHEVFHGVAFIGAGGRKIRDALGRAVDGAAPLAGDEGLEAALAVGRYAFWTNTVPYKPVGNKAWSAREVRAFQPAMTALLRDGWDGDDVLCLGKGAVDWFARDKATKAAVAAHWAREDRYDAALELPFPDAPGRTVRLHPLPHPSPLNATWAPHVPRLFDAALARVGVGPGRWLR